MSTKMKWAVLAVAILSLFVVSAALAAAPDPFKMVLDKGRMAIYDFGDVKLHAYQTENLMNEESFIFEGKNALVIAEPPAFHSSLRVFKKYADDLGKPIAGVMISYHVTGADHFPGVPVYSSPGTQASIYAGGLAAMLANFKEIYDDDFDSTVFRPTEMITSPRIEIGGIAFNIFHNVEGYDFDVPTAGVVYTHLLGEKGHAVVFSLEGFDSLIDTFQGYQARNYNLILSSHHTPEKPGAIKTKIAYLERAKGLVQSSKNRAAYIATMKEVFPNYGALNYLEMSAGALFEK